MPRFPVACSEAFGVILFPHPPGFFFECGDGISCALASPGFHIIDCAYYRIAKSRGPFRFWATLFSEHKLQSRDVRERQAHRQFPPALLVARIDLVMLE